ncbi:DUF2784 domain-containing protein [Nitrosomonas ureae]|uniref:Uncharacterized protein DUF2784 n=1 Tax=Nitrosomonas ureae TaxID=44577 RepID=A0A0S3AHK0_9PROT|nr:DUF2784 domain-containing protein [Nitrosomonas ureae]ALQ50663.1 hypothetical protein ATY38_05100 [Nitrosomonas ureae]PTQ88076.1 uncharacterized protein DUF2784 [Nitrosomonas ureae]SDT84060.1 Protein of Unknown function [Nitrosomonas ureae]SEQ49121.1 Protein of Unknown function [Nitrosomonas ureae]
MLLADIVLIIHFLYVLFVVGSLPIIWIGAWLKLTFVRNPWFRYLHLAAILFVVGESLLGIACPLTLWENSLRQIETDKSFIQHWLHFIIFYNVPETILAIIYSLFAGLVAMTFKWVPIRRIKVD